MTVESEWDEYFLMQHYGLPTRFLDWSESALVALYFAVGAEPRRHEPSDAAVWMLDPWWFTSELDTPMKCISRQKNGRV
jgi:hypothetical protein